ncbi:MAG: TolC family protein [Syntrophales bacterium]
MNGQKYEVKSEKLKSKKRRLIPLISLLALFSAQYAHAMEYSLVDLYRIALDRSERIHVSRNDVQIAEREKDRARSAFVPALSAFGSYTKYSTDKNEGSGSTNVLIQPQNAASWGAKLEQALSMGGKEITAYKISNEDIERSNHDLNAVKESNLSTVATSYYDLLRAKKTLEIARANAERLTKHRDAAAVRLKVGEVTKTDLLRAEAELSGAQSDLVRAVNFQKLAKAILARYVGITSDFDVKGPEAQMETGSPTLEALKETAFMERAELKSYSLQKKIAEDRIRLAKSAYWPTISVEGGYLGQEQNPSLPFAVNDSLWAGVALNIPIFEGGLRRAEVGQAEAKSRQSGFLYDDLRKAIAIEVEDSWLDHQTQRGVLHSLRDQLKFAADNYYSVSKQYQFGLANSIDVIDANTLLLNTERQLTDAEFNYRLSLVRMQRSSGVLLKTIMGEIH